MKPHLIWAAVALAAFAPTLRWLIDRWTMSVWNNIHGLFVPVIVALATVQILKARNEPAQPSPLGFLFLVPSALLLAADAALRTDLLSAIALVLFLPGLSLVLLGVPATRALAFPLAFSVFMLPIPTVAIEQLQIGLRAVSAAGAEQVLHLLGFSVFRQGTTLSLPTGSLLVANACSGFSTLHASVCLGAVMAYCSPSTRRRIVIAVAALICPLAANVLRCATLALTVSSNGLAVLDSPLHVMSGVAAFALVAVTLVLLSGQSRSSTA
jgi:exosortase